MKDSVVYITQQGEKRYYAGDESNGLRVFVREKAAAKKLTRDEAKRIAVSCWGLVEAI